MKWLGGYTLRLARSANLLALVAYAALGGVIFPFVAVLQETGP